jgi:hypothetical protein
MGTAGYHDTLYDELLMSGVPRPEARPAALPTSTTS